MGKKVNIWLDDATLRLWKKIPTGERSAIIKGAIRSNSTNEPNDPKTEMINMKLAELANINMEIENLEHKRIMIENELKNLSLGEDILEIPKEKFWNTIESRAAIYRENKSVYHSYSSKSAYSIFDVANDKIYISNLRTGRNNSNFSKRTTDIAIDRLIAHGGEIPAGQFIPVKMHEYTVVALHPNLMEKDGCVCWINEDVIPVTEDMIPEHNGEMPPEEWISTDNFLAVLIDGKKALIGHGRKIVIFFREEHPNFNVEENPEYPWQTKYWKWIGPGILYWGHHSETQKIVTKPLGGE
jgi:hypothetical protein